MTAVEWLVNQLEQNKFITESQIHIAKEMEKQEQENFASWCIKKRIDLFDSTEIGETYTIDGFVSKYKINELLEIYKKEE
jgi:hypothetical protein